MASEAVAAATAAVDAVDDAALSTAAATAASAAATAAVMPAAVGGGTSSAGHGRCDEDAAGATAGKGATVTGAAGMTGRPTAHQGTLHTSPWSAHHAARAAHPTGLVVDMGVLF